MGIDQLAEMTVATVRREMAVATVRRKNLLSRYGNFCNGEKLSRGNIYTLLQCPFVIFFVCVCQLPVAIVSKVIVMNIAIVVKAG